MTLLLRRIFLYSFGLSNTKCKGSAFVCPDTICAGTADGVLGNGVITASENKVLFKLAASSGDRLVNESLGRGVENVFLKSDTGGDDSPLLLILSGLVVSRSIDMSEGNDLRVGESKIDFRALVRQLSGKSPKPLSMLDGVLRPIEGESSCFRIDDWANDGSADHTDEYG